MRRGDGGKSRKGLKRIGMREYQITGPCGSYIIERVRRARYHVRPSHFHPAFYLDNFNLLRFARTAAEAWAGLRHIDALLDIPTFLDKRPKR